MDIAGLTASLAHLSLEWIALVIVALVGALDGYTSGASRAASASVALILAVALAPIVSGTAFLSSIPSTIPHLAAIMVAALAVIAYLLVRRMTESYGYGTSSFMSALLGGFGFVAIVVCTWIASPGLSALWAFSPSMQSIFGESVRLYWTIGGLTALAFARG